MFDLAVVVSFFFIIFLYCQFFEILFLQVIDASSGIQPQTAEHLLLCSIFCPEKVVIVLNKIDLVQSSEVCIFLFLYLCYLVTSNIKSSQKGTESIRDFGIYASGSTFFDDSIRRAFRRPDEGAGKMFIYPKSI